LFIFFVIIIILSYTHAGASILGGMTYVASLEFQGEEKLLEILYNVMQQPVGHDWQSL